MKSSKPRDPPANTRRFFLETAATAGTALGASLLLPESAHALNEHGCGTAKEPRPNPIPGGVAPFKPFAIMIHHFPLNPAVPVADINDPSQITDFKGFVGLTHIRGGGIGTDTTTGVSAPMAFQADMGFSTGKFIDNHGRRHEGTFAFV